MSTVYRGTVDRLNMDTGMGAILAEDGRKVRLNFVHMVGATYKNLKPGDTVEFEIEEGRRGPEGRKVNKVEE